MKKLILIGSVLFFAACGQNSSKSEEHSGELAVLTVDDVQKKGDDLVGKELYISGTVSHVCKHGGERCFLMGSSEDVSIRVEAGYDIGSFNQEQMGSELKVKGILQEIRIDDAYVAEMEAEMDTEGELSDGDHAMGHAGEGNHEIDGGNHDQEKLDQIAEMKKKIAVSGKGYYSIFYLDGISSEEIQ